MCCRYIKALEPFYDSFDPEFVNSRKATREILQKEDDLNEIVQLVGKVGWRQLSCLHGGQPAERATCALGATGALALARACACACTPANRVP